ncbi:MAG: thioredoxin domain-containing protein [Yoonia sp.]|nr:thioredoxin domain-containing protein [Yoonia sp.]
MKRIALALAMTLASPTFAQEAMTEAERTSFRAEVRAYLMENPEVLMEAIGVLEQREQAAKANSDVTLAQTYAGQLHDDPNSFVGGNLEGDITIVEFMDYKCGYCKKAYPEVAQLLTTDGNIKYIVKEFPILGDQSMLAAQFAIATKIVAGDDAYETVHNTLMEFRGDITQDSLSRLAASLELDLASISVEMNGAQVAKIINDNRLLGQAMQISGTPTFVVEDQMLRGYVPFDQMVRIVDAIRSEG